MSGRDEIHTANRVHLKKRKIENEMKKKPMKFISKWGKIGNKMKKGENEKGKKI